MLHGNSSAGKINGSSQELHLGPDTAEGAAPSEFQYHSGSSEAPIRLGDPESNAFDMIVRQIDQERDDKKILDALQDQKLTVSIAWRRWAEKVKSLSLPLLKR